MSTACKIVITKLQFVGQNLMSNLPQFSWQCRAVNVCLAERMLVCERSMNVLWTDVLGTSCPMCMKPEKDTYVITSKVVRLYSSWKKNFDALTTERVVLIKSHTSIHINLLNLLFS
jgi:hypothetical protein